MKDRANVVALLTALISGNHNLTPGKSQWHIGYQELRILLDYIYESEPTCKEEELNKDE